LIQLLVKYDILQRNLNKNNKQLQTEFLQTNDTESLTETLLLSEKQILKLFNRYDKTIIFKLTQIELNSQLLFITKNQLVIRNE
jgi:hypothetical protein